MVDKIKADLDIAPEDILAAVQGELDAMLAPLAQQLLDLQGQLDAIQAQLSVIDGATDDLRVALQEWASKA